MSAFQGLRKIASFLVWPPCISKSPRFWKAFILSALSLYTLKGRCNSLKHENNHSQEIISQERQYTLDQTTVLTVLAGIPLSRTQACHTSRVPARVAISTKNNQSKWSADHRVPLACLCVDWRVMKECKRAWAQITLQSNKGRLIRLLESSKTPCLQVI